jgi:hypothetical protein
MRDHKSLSHTRWDCKYHIVFIPKKREKILFGAIRIHLGEIFHELAKRQGVVIEDGALDERSCSYVPQHTAEISSIECGRSTEGQKRDIYSENVQRQTEELYR